MARQGFGKSWYLGAIIGTAIALGFALPDFYRAVSRAAPFDRIEVGMSSIEASEVLRHAHIRCGITDGSTSGECYFSDFGADYLVRLDPKANRVMQKSYWIRRHR
jgi:hypothetical protein